MNLQFLIQQARIIYKVDPFEITRKREFVNARTAIIVLLNINYVQKEIVKLVKLDRNTVTHCLIRHKDLYEYDKEYKNLFDLFKLKVKLPNDNTNYAIVSYLCEVIGTMISNNYLGGI